MAQFEAKKLNISNVNNGNKYEPMKDNVSIETFNEIIEGIEYLNENSGGSTTEIIDNLTSTDTDKALSAKQGNELHQLIKNIKYIADIEFNLSNDNDYILSIQLKDQAGNTLGTPKTINLPLESMVVNGEYDNDSKKVKLTLQNGNKLEFSVSDLVQGLQNKLTQENAGDNVEITEENGIVKISAKGGSAGQGIRTLETAPTTETQGYVGEIVQVQDGTSYQCAAVADGVYTWVKMINQTVGAKSGWGRDKMGAIAFYSNPFITGIVPHNESGLVFPSLQTPTSTDILVRSANKAITPKTLNEAVKAALTDTKRIGQGSSGDDGYVAPLTDTEKQNAREIFDAASTADLNAKVDKYTSGGATRIYAVNRNGVAEMRQVMDTEYLSNITSLIPQYFDNSAASNPGATLTDKDGVLLTGTPNQPYQAANKKYVDENKGTKWYKHHIEMYAHKYEDYSESYEIIFDIYSTNASDVTISSPNVFVALCDFLIINPYVSNGGYIGIGGQRIVDVYALSTEELIIDCKTSTLQIKFSEFYEFYITDTVTEV